MERNIESTGDVITYLKRQHQQIKAMFDEVLGAKGKEREEAFRSIRRLLAVHETAEEEVIHPAARRSLPNGDGIVRARLREEADAKTALSAIEQLEVDSPEFETQFRTLRQNVISHAESEEALEFQALGQALEPERLSRMRRVFELAEAIAPTRPHPGIESATANLLVGPFASMLDRARDALHQRT
jgi:hemerythrin superfamily protein